MITITAGLTGNICSGKSTVEKTLTAHNIPVVDADLLSRQVVALGTFGLQKLIEVFGSEYLLADGNLDRQKFGTFIFSNKEAILQLNSILHPLIREEAAKQIEAFHNSGHQIVVYSAALLGENHNKDQYQPLIITQCTSEQQLTRLMKRGTGHGPIHRRAAEQIISAQTPIDQKIAGLNFQPLIINTTGSIENSIKQTENVILCLKIELRDKQMIAQGKR